MEKAPLISSRHHCPSLPEYGLAKISAAICSFLQAFHQQQPKETSWLNPSWGRVWSIFLAQPRLLLLWLSNPARILQEATPAALGGRPAPMRHCSACWEITSVLGAGEECGHGSVAAPETSAREHLPRPALAWCTHPVAPFALG